MSKYIIIEKLENGNNCHYGPFANQNKANDYISVMFRKQNPQPFSLKKHNVFVKKFKVKSLCPAIA